MTLWEALQKLSKEFSGFDPTRSKFKLFRFHADAIFVCSILVFDDTGNDMAVQPSSEIRTTLPLSDVDLLKNCRV
jgi:hypothetical protein